VKFFAAVNIAAHMCVTKFTMARTYTLKKRAENQAETRQRIVQAAMELHGELGPARTSISQVAERAGVQRHTVYAHFPDDWNLLLACSELDLRRHPAPDPEPWGDIADRRERLATGLVAIYAWYASNPQVFASIVRDAEYHLLTRDIIALRFLPILGNFFEVLGDGLTPRQTALLRLALGFHTWRTLAKDGGLSNEDAAEAMAGAILAA
jgi:AcrR family transcriptional regulator